ncbi:MAG: hypothetical protein CVU89_15250 [Firmicutes bacterium HGW-Firmicutes-14]|jgi:hypothetical protein|nr:MAG: hypothetical protein CVU89_15250 [Firmicutes bacterium HGW-Firmicutes-14]
MLVILRDRTRKRITLGIRVLATLFIASLVISHLINMYNGKDPIREGWLREDRPSGNPMRVEISEQTVKKEDPSILDRFVVKLRDFYRIDP